MGSDCISSCSLLIFYLLLCSKTIFIVAPFFFRVSDILGVLRSNVFYFFFLFRYAHDCYRV